MKKTAHILGLPIISITEGKELGISKSLLMDAKNGVISALIIEDEDWYRGVKLLPYAAVTAIGDDAITITSSENILKLSEATEYEPLLTANIKIIGTKAITKTGSIHGFISEIIIDENGKVAKCEITTKDGEVSELSSEQVSIFGKQVTIIDSETPSKTTEISTSPEVTASPESSASPVIEVVPEKEPVPVAAKPTTQQLQQPQQTGKPQLDKAAEERHRRFLLGKKASRRIATDNGIVIVEAGADITEEVLQKAKLSNKFVELSMNIQ